MPDSPAHPPPHSMPVVPSSQRFLRQCVGGTYHSRRCPSKWRAHTRRSDFQQALLDAEQTFEDVAQASLSSKMAPDVLAQFESHAVRQLSAATTDVRQTALKRLGTLPPVALAKHATEVLTVLQNDDSDDVRREALRTLGKLPLEELAKHSDAIAARLEDDALQMETLALLRRLPDERLSLGARTTVARLLHDSEYSPVFRTLAPPRAPSHLGTPRTPSQALFPLAPPRTSSPCYEDDDDRIEL